MKLYIHPASPNSRAVLVAAALLEIQLDLEFVDLTPGGQRKAEYLSINPNGYVPVLVDGDFTLWETDAILQYLGGVAGSKRLWPDDLQGKADVTRWQFWSKCHWTPTLQTFVFENVFKGHYGLGAPDLEKLEVGQEKLGKFAAVLSQPLAKYGFVTGDEMTLADLSLASYLIYAEAARVPIHDFSAIAGWAERVLAHEGWTRELDFGHETASPNA